MGDVKRSDEKSEGKILTDEKMEELIREFEEDSKTQDFSDPEMDRIFQDVIDDVVRKDRRKRVAKVASIAAGVVITFGVALNGFTEVTYGESLIEIVRNSIEAGQFTISGIGAGDKSKQFDEYDTPIICYEDEGIDKIFEQIVDDSNVEISKLFYIQNLPDKYTQWTAQYNKDFQTLTINSKQKNNYLYILEELDYENIVSGTVLESEIAVTIFNENLQMNIDIIAQMDNVRLEGYYFEVFYDDMRLLIEGNGILEEFENIAENISVWERD